MTYNKKLKTLAVYLMLDSEPITIADTADDDKATRALNEFKKYGSMHYETEDGGEKVTNEIPYHAVQYIEVTEADASVERPDPYGCEGGSEPTGEVWYTGTLGEECNGGFAMANLSETDIADTASLVADPSNYTVNVNGTEVSYIGTQEGFVGFADSTSDMTVALSIATSQDSVIAQIKCPPTTTTVEVTVTHN